MFRKKTTIDGLVYKNVKKLPAPVPAAHVLPKSTPKGMVFFVEPSSVEAELPRESCEYCKTPRQPELYGLGSIWRCEKCLTFYHMKENKYASKGKLWSKMEEDEIVKARVEGRIVEEA